MLKRRNNEQGLTMIELMIVVGLGLIIMGMAIGGAPAMLKTSRADGGLAELASAVRAGREAAISNRRNVQLAFGTNTISLTRVEYCPSTCTTGGSGTWSTYSGCTSTCTAQTTALRTVTLEGRTEFRVISGMADTPDSFGNSTATSLGSSLPAMFTTDGSFINQNGDVLNGSLFIAIPGESISARAITIFGPTGMLHLWKWNGRAWVEA